MGLFEAIDSAFVSALESSCLESASRFLSLFSFLKRGLTQHQMEVSEHTTHIKTPQVTRYQKQTSMDGFVQFKERGNMEYRPLFLRFISLN